MWFWLKELSQLILIPELIFQSVKAALSSPYLLDFSNCMTYEMRFSKPIKRLEITNFSHRLANNAIIIMITPLSSFTDVHTGSDTYIQKLSAQIFKPNSKFNVKESDDRSLS